MAHPPRLGLRGDGYGGPEGGAALRAARPGWLSVSGWLSVRRWGGGVRDRKWVGRISISVLHLGAGPKKHPFGDLFIGRERIERG